MKKTLILAALLVPLSANAAQQTWSNGDALSDVRTKIQANDTELYAQAATKWLTGKAYTADNQIVVHGGNAYVCTSNHTAGSTTEPGTGASWATVWAYVGASQFYTKSEIDTALGNKQDSLGTIGSAGYYLVEETALGVHGLVTPGNWKMAYTDASGAGLKFFDIGTTGYVLTSQGTAGAPIWTAAGSGDVAGPASATANSIAVFDGTTGKLVKVGGCSIDATTNALSCTTSDGERILSAVNTVAISATATEGRIGYYNGRMRLADGTDWDGYFLEDTDASGFVSEVASGTASLGTSAISDGACATVVTATATGTATTDVISWGFNGDPTSTTGYNPSGGLLFIVAYPTANNVNFKVCNKSGASITPGAITLNWRVDR